MYIYFMILIRSDMMYYDVLLWIVSGVVLQLLHDVDMLSDMILIWFQLWFLMWVKIVIWSQPIETISKIVSKPYQNCIKIVSKPYQNHSKSYQNHKNLREIDQKGCPAAVSVSFSWSQPVGNPEKGAPFPHNPNDIYKKHNKTISKS